MKNRFQKTPILLVAISFAFICLSQSSWSQAIGKSGETPDWDLVIEGRHVGNAQRSKSRVADLSGEWKVKCETGTYQDGKLQNSSQDKEESLVVAEQTTDGSYYLDRFPFGFGEAFPPLRRTSPGDFAGQDTVRGISYLVKQTVEIEGEKISIKQVVTHAPTKQVVSEISCTGQRLISGMSALPTTQVLSDEGCPSDTLTADVVPAKIARRYEAVKPFSDGLAAVGVTPRGRRNRKWGFIDTTGRVVVPIEYDVVTPFYQGLAKVGRFLGHEHNIKWGVVEKLGPQVTSHLNFDDVKILGSGFAAVGYTVPGQGLKWNLINRENTPILEGFDDFGCFAGGRARAVHSDRNGLHQGYINNVGDFFESK